MAQVGHLTPWPQRDLRRDSCSLFRLVSPFFNLESFLVNPTISPARFHTLEHPLRPPTWRWLRALDLAGNRQLLNEQDDEGVRQALRFYQQQRRSHGAAAQEEWTLDLLAFSQAYALFSGPPSLQ